MVQARHRFLDSGCYQPVIDALTKATRTALDGVEHPVILDAGCGEGYYTTQLHDAFPQASVCGFDISKPAIQACCRRSKDVHGWLPVLTTFLCQTIRLMSLSVYFPAVTGKSSAGFSSLVGKFWFWHQGNNTCMHCARLSMRKFAPIRQTSWSASCQSISACWKKVL